MSVKGTDKAWKGNEDKERLVLTVLTWGPMTVDEFVQARGWYVNTWAPIFTKLRQRGLVQRTGKRRQTTHGSMAHVIELTAAGYAALEKGAA